MNLFEGTQPFGPLELRVRAPVLIPRPETEDWTIRLARLLSPTRAAPLSVLDICTGTGCIPLLLCNTWPGGSTRALGVDIGSEAIALARENAERVGIRVSEHNEAQSNENTLFILQADILKDSFSRTLKELGWSPFDVLTSNPPYIPVHEYNELPSSVKNYEDPRALLGDPASHTTGDRDGDGRGLTFYRAIAGFVADGLVKRGGVVALEVGHDQSAEVQQLMQTNGRVQRTEVWNDPWNVARTVVCWA